MKRKAFKKDLGKLRYDLLPFDALDEVVRVLTYGCFKYSQRNWESGLDWGRIIGSLLRHTSRFAAGEDLDPETRISHMAHAAANTLFLLTYQLRKVGKDDRSKEGKHAAERSITYAHTKSSKNNGSSCKTLLHSRNDNRRAK